MYISLGGHATVPGMKVQIAYVHNDMIGFNFFHSLQQVKYQHPQLFTTNDISTFAASMQLVEARNHLVNYFLSNNDLHQATHLWFLDTDMGFHPDNIIKLLHLNKPIASSLCYGMKQVGPDDMGGYHTEQFTTTYEFVQNPHTNLVHFSHYPIPIDNSAHKVDGTGTGNLLIERAALEKIQSEYGKQWFDQVGQLTEENNKVHRLSEDLSFCYRAKTLALAIYVHTNCPTNHAKTVYVQ